MSDISVVHVYYGTHKFIILSILSETFLDFFLMSVCKLYRYIKAIHIIVYVLLFECIVLYQGTTVSHDFTILSELIHSLIMSTLIVHSGIHNAFRISDSTQPSFFLEGDCNVESSRIHLMNVNQDCVKHNACTAFSLWIIPYRLCDTSYIHCIVLQLFILWRESNCVILRCSFTFLFLFNFKNWHISWTISATEWHDPIDPSFHL